MEEGSESREVWSVFVRGVVLLREGGLHQLCTEPTITVMENKVF